MTNLVKQSDFRGHRRRLREVLAKRFDPRTGGAYELAPVPLGGDTVSIVIQRGPFTVDAINERQGIEVCGILATFGERRMLCSLYEAWKAVSTNRYRFDQA